MFTKWGLLIAGNVYLRGMIRVYLDKQIFSYLWKGNDPVYQKLLDQLYRHKGSFLYCYSHAHLLDLKNDTTQKKYEELDFMTSLVDTNYVSYHAIKKYTSYYMVAPREAFQQIEEEQPISFSSLFDFDVNLLNDEQKEQLEKAKALLHKKLDFSLPQTDQLPAEIQPLTRMFPADSHISIIELTERFMGLLKDMQENNSIYRDLRNMVDKGLNNGKFTVDYDSIDFNEDLKNSLLQKSFVDYVTDNLNPNGDKEITDYDFFINAYFTLDLLGISKEKSSKVAFRNVMNDGVHGYYGAWCDYVVSNDNGFLKKVKTMYKLLGIDVQVMRPEEFLQAMEFIGGGETDWEQFQTLLCNDIENGLVVGSRPSLAYDRHTTIIKPRHTYMGYFNQLELLKDSGQNFIALSRRTKNYSQGFFYKEIESVVNRAVKLFGTDDRFKEEYVWPQENGEINDKWPGRAWVRGNLTLTLEINPGPQKLMLWIVPNNT